METIQRALLSRMSEATRGAVREATSRSLIGQGKTGSARRGGEPDNANRRFVTRYIERSTFLFIQKRRNFIYIYIFMIHHVTHGHDFGFEGWARRERWKIIFQASNFEFVPKVKNIDN